MSSSPPSIEEQGRHQSPPPSSHVQQPPAALPQLLTTPTSGSQRRVAIAVDLSEESAYAVRWSVQNYLRPGDTVILLHVRPTNVLYGADWGALQVASPSREDHRSAEQIESDYDDLTSSKTGDLARPLVEAQVPYKIHIVKDHDMKERLCLEVERLGLSAMIMGSRGFGATRSRANKLGRLGSVSDYCVQHCVCPVVVIRYPDDDGGAHVGQQNTLFFSPDKREEQIFHFALVMLMVSAISRKQNLSDHIYRVKLTIWVNLYMLQLPKICKKIEGKRGCRKNGSCLGLESLDGLFVNKKSGP